MAAARRCYNIAIALQRQSSKRISVFELEKLVVNDDSLPSWIKEVPRAIKVNAVKDAHAAYLKSKDAKFRSCRDQQQTIKFKNENYSKGTWYPRLTKGLTFKSVLPVPTNCDYGTQITKVKDRWYGIFPEVRFVLAKV
jgi:putative transposase